MTESGKVAVKSLSVAVVASQSKFCDVDANLEHFESFIKEASEKGARLACFPELALTSYTMAPAVLKVAESIPGSSTDKLAKIAAVHNIYLSMGMAEKNGEDFFISQIIVGPDGYMGKYRKHHLAGPGEQGGFSAGVGFPIFDIDDFKLGVNICYDGRFPDTIEAMREARVDVIHHPHGNWLGQGKDAEEWTRGKLVYFVARAVHARAYILINNSAGDTAHPVGVAKFGSGALILDPLGQVVSRTTQKSRSEKMIITTITRPLSTLIPDFELKWFKDN
jgi:predicted amidohydrolase